MKICKRCGRYYKRSKCEYCKREKNWNKYEALKHFPPRIEQKLQELDIEVRGDAVDCIRYDKGSVFITGVIGSGKTLYAAKIAMECKKLNYVEGIGPASFVMVNTIQLFDDYRGAIKEDNGHADQKYLGKHLLIIDDLGVEKLTDWSLQTLHKIVDFRYENKRPTIFISNLGQEEMSEQIGRRIPSRIEEMCQVKITMGEKSYR